jgi:hypothetical protein
MRLSGQAGKCHIFLSVRPGEFERFDQAPGSEDAELCGSGDGLALVDGAQFAILFTEWVH